jgi:hypothetical protein
MTLTVQSGQEKTCSIELVRADRRVRLMAAFGEPFVGGSLLVVLPDGLVAVEAADNAAKNYTFSTWLSGLTSGALYAFRALKVPRRRIWLSQLEGRLGSGDMGAVAMLASLVVAKLAGQEPPALDLGDWVIGLVTDNGPS